MILLTNSAFGKTNHQEQRPHRNTDSKNKPKTEWEQGNQLEASSPESTM